MTTLPDLPTIDGLDENQVRSLVYCRTYKQYHAMMERYLKGICTFCDPLDPEKNKLVHENAMWRMWTNPFPIPNTSLHLIIASRRHIAPGDEIRQEDFTAMGELFLWAQKEYGFTGGGFAMRFGSPLQSAGTVLHLHANIIIPDQTGVVEVTLAKDPEKMREQIARMFVFEKLREGVSAHDLTPEEFRLVEDRA